MTTQMEVKSRPRADFNIIFFYVVFVSFYNLFLFKDTTEGRINEV